MLYYSRDRDEIFVVNLVFRLSPNTFFTWKKRQILQSQTQQVSCSWTCSFEWSCKIRQLRHPGARCSGSESPSASCRDDSLSVGAETVGNVQFD